MVKDNESDEIGIRVLLSEIVTAYEQATQIDKSDYLSGLLSIIATDLAQIGGRNWGWRYVYNVLKGKQSPSRFLSPAIVTLHSRLSEMRRPRRYRLIAQVSEEEYNAVKAEAARRGVTMSEYVRRKVNG